MTDDTIAKQYVFNETIKNHYQSHFKFVDNAMQNYSLPDYFPENPWACSCGCGFAEINPALVKRLNLARGVAGVEFHITSACRCRKHNEAEGGKPSSAHLTGEAADISTPSGLIRLLVVRSLIFSGFNRLGIGKTFVHADISKILPSPNIWLYD